MTSTTGKDAGLITPIEKKRFLQADKNGAPLNRQVPRTQQSYTGTGGETITLNGSNYLFVTTALAGVLTINCQDVSNLRGRLITIYVRGGVGQNVAFQFPAAGYPVYNTGTAGTVTALTVATSANNQRVQIEFGQNFGWIL